MGRKLGALPPFGEGLMQGPHLTQSRLAEAYLHTKWHLNSSSQLATTDMGQNWGGDPPPFGGGGLGPRVIQSRMG